MNSSQTLGFSKLLLLFLAVVIITLLTFAICKKDDGLAEKVVRSKTPVGAIGDSTQTKWEEDNGAH